jgi:hypothetical protein
MVYSPINVKLVQNSFTSGALLVSLDPSGNAPIVCQKYDIRVVANNFSVIGTDAIATKTVINDFTITSTPLSFAIPINPDVMSDGAKYKVTIRLYSSSSTTYTPPTDNLFYYDTRVYTIAPSVAGGAGGVSVSSNPTGVDSSFDITDVVVFRGSSPLMGTDPFFSDVGVSKLFMSCTTLDVFNNIITTGTEYSLASALFVTSNLPSTSYNFKITSEMNQRVTDAAYELWGYLSLSSQFTFGINIVANDATIGYVINNPAISVKLGDVIGTVSDDPIEITIDSWTYYKNNYMFDSLTLEIRDASSNLLLKDASDNSMTYTKTSSQFTNNVVKFSKDDLVKATNESPLMNGVNYKFKTILNFTNSALYKPNFVRSTTKEGQFTDAILPIVSGSAVNSWQLNSDQSDGLVVEFKKTDQFYGLSGNRPYNLEGNTKVKAEYRTFDTSGNKWQENWSVLSGGSISQPTLPSGVAAGAAAANYDGSTNNTTGVYDVPVYNIDEKRGNIQPPVYIYAIIPDRAKYNAVQIRLSLTTTNIVFNSKTSTDYAVPKVLNTTYTTYSNNQVVDNTVTFRYHPKPVAHDFAKDKPICTSSVIIPNAFYVRTGGSNWRDFIPLLTANSTTNLQAWGPNPDWQFVLVDYAPHNEIAKQFSYFAGYWLNRNRASTGQSYSVPVFYSNGSLGTFTFTATKDYPVSTSDTDSSYTGFLSSFPYDTYALTAQLDGITAGQNAVPFDVPLTVYPFFKAVVTTSDGFCDGIVANITNSNAYDASWNLPLARTGQGLSYTPANASFTLSVKYVSSENSAISVETLMTVQMHGFPSNSFSITSCKWNKSNQQVDYTLSTVSNDVKYRIDGWNLYTSATDASGNAIKDASGNEVSLQQSRLTSDSGGLTQSVALARVNYLDYKNITVKFVATRSLYLNASDLSNQAETVGDGVRDTKQASVTKLPAVLPLIDFNDITLENTVYNVKQGGTQSARLSAKSNYPANGLQIIDTNSSPNPTTNALFYDVTLPTPNSSPGSFSRSYQIKAKYDSVDTTDVYSLPVTVTFMTSISDRPAPVIVSKDTSGNNFIVMYTSMNNGPWNEGFTLLSSSDVYVKPGSSDDQLIESNILNNPDIKSVNLGQFKGGNVNMWVKDKFTTTYKVDKSVATGISSDFANKTSIQIVNSPSVAFVLAANPQIVENSVVVNGTDNVITVNVNNMGTPLLDNVLLVVSQDSTNNENDPGYYSLAYFMRVNNVFTNKFTGSQNMSVSDTDTGMSKVTTLTFSSINLTNTNPVNVVLFVGNIVEGSDSCAVTKAISYPIRPPVMKASNGVTNKYILSSIPSGQLNPYIIQVPEGSGTYYAIMSNSQDSKDKIRAYANNFWQPITHSAIVPFVANGTKIPFAQIVTTLMQDMSSLFEYFQFNSLFTSQDTYDDLSTWDVSNVTNMHSMFRQTQFGGFNPNIVNWDVSNVTTMTGMFQSSVFNRNISQWNVTKVTYYSYFTSMSSLIKANIPEKFRSTFG